MSLVTICFHVLFSVACRSSKRSNKRTCVVSEEVVFAIHPVVAAEYVDALLESDARVQRTLNALVK